MKILKSILYYQLPENIKDYIKNDLKSKGLNLGRGSYITKIVCDEYDKGENLLDDYFLSLGFIENEEIVILIDW